MLLTSEPYLVNSPCLVGRGAGASLAARIIAKERKMEILCGMLINPLSVWSSLDSWTAEAEFGRYRKNFARYGNADLSKYTKDISESGTPLLLVDEGSGSLGHLIQTFSLSRSTQHTNINTNKDKYKLGEIQIQILPG